MPRGGEPAHVQADLGDDDRGHIRPDPRDLIKPGDRVSERGQMVPDLGLDRGNVGAHRIDPGQHP